MRFTKMHGLGNDYVYVDGFAGRVPADPAAMAIAVSDRHFGIGGDGLILILPSEVADARMRMFNADGSESEMCGNGVRCVAKYVYDHGIARKPELRIETGRGVLTFQLTTGPDGKVAKVRVNMGEPILDAAKIPTTCTTSRVIDEPLTVAGPEFPAGWAEACGLDPRMTCVSMGNPHVVLYCRDVARVPLEAVGPVLENASLFPRRINVHFVQKHSDDEVTMRTWERGSGITLACGTGACAVAVAGVLTGRTGGRLLAHLPGGDLELEWGGEGQPVFMTGPATEVFSGEWHGRETASEIGDGGGATVTA
jgi:diaminopimelate epimerase